VALGLETTLGPLGPRFIRAFEDSSREASVKVLDDCVPLQRQPPR